MRRVVSVWFPHWPTDRLSRRAPPAEASGAPLVTAAHDGRRRVIAATDPAAAALGLRPGQAMAQALAMVPALRVVEAEPEADAEALRRLTLWCHRFTPLAAPAPPDGLWLDVAGAAHLFGGESALLARLLDRLGRDGITARAAVADTPGAAHAMARHGGDACIVVPPGGQAEAVAPLPVAALRLAPELDATLRRLGFERIGHLVRVPRAVLGRRFGPLPGLRLDQIQGRAAEPLRPLRPDAALQQREAFLEPLSTADALAVAIDRLVRPLCAAMEAAGLGARRLDLVFERVDHQVAAIRIGTARPTRDAPHLTRLLQERLETVDPGLGVETMHLMVPLAEPLAWEQQASGAGSQAVGRLVDRLSSRLGAERVYRATPLERHQPEHAVGKAAAVLPQPCAPACLPREAVPEPEPVQAAPTRRRPVLGLVASASGLPSDVPAPQPGGRYLRLVEVEPDDEPRVVLPWKPRYGQHRPSALRRAWAMGHGARVAAPSAWPTRLKAPSRLLSPPRPIQAVAGLPDQPPVFFIWRRRHRVRRAEGPERIHEPWWHEQGPCEAVRDYFQVEVEDGQRFWLFRHGNGLDPRTGDLQWFLHGIF